MSYIDYYQQMLECKTEYSKLKEEVIELRKSFFDSSIVIKELKVRNNALREALEHVGDVEVYEDDNY